MAHGEPKQSKVRNLLWHGFLVPIPLFVKSTKSCEMYWYTFSSRGIITRLRKNCNNRTQKKCMHYDKKNCSIVRFVLMQNKECIHPSL